MALPAPTYAQPHAQPDARRIPVCRPWAPPAHAIAPYLERIDAARWYSNFGPLVLELEDRLAARFQSGTRIVTVTNGTLALALTLRARAPRGGLCLIPSWTFVATAHAALLAGLTP
ncbi:MAG: DegT/DnrJ/EryC1/StrS family aminotransferase, partial [Caulobacterales bacterium]